MARKSKQVVWHKRKGRMISATLLKPHHPVPASKDPEALPAHPSVVEKKKIFARSLLTQIHKAVRPE